MEKHQQEYKNINEYISGFPEEIQKTLQELRAVIKAGAAGAEEKISYQMPTFYLKGNLIHFAAFKSHIGLYPAPSGIDAFEKELAEYRTGKGTLQFPLDQPLPLELIKRIVAFRVAENLRKAEEKKRKGK